MTKFWKTALLLVLCASPASALTGRGSFVFSSAVKFAGLRPLPCPGKLGNAQTRCATSSTDKTQVQAKLSKYKGWKQTDPWKAGSAGFTSTGTDQFIVTVMNKIGGGKGSLVIVSEF